MTQLPNRCEIMSFSLNWFHVALLFTEPEASYIFRGFCCCSCFYAQSVFKGFCSFPSFWTLQGIQRIVSFLLFCRSGSGSYQREINCAIPTGVTVICCCYVGWVAPVALIKVCNYYVPGSSCPQGGLWGRFTQLFSWPKAHCLSLVPQILGIKQDICIEMSSPNWTVQFTDNTKRKDKPFLMGSGAVHELKLVGEKIETFDISTFLLRTTTWQEACSG